MSRAKKRKRRVEAQDNISVRNISDETKKRFELFAIATLLVFGIYQSIQFFGHTSVPNSDFPLFVKVAKSILSLEVPSNFKRLPGLGFLQIGLSKFVTSNHPVLTAGWLLNAILHPASMVLFYLIAREIIGKAAFWLAIVLSINSQVVYMLTQPMAETTMLFFVMLTFYLIIKRSSWCYVAACAATIIRYDAGALIVAAFAADLINSKNKKQILYAISKSAIAFIPLGAWFVLTKLNWQTSSKSHYFNHYTASRHIGMGYLELLWRTSIGSMPQLSAWVEAVFVKKPSQNEIQALQQASSVLFGISKLLAAIGALTAIVYSLLKKNLKVIPILVFLACNIAVHMMRLESKPRYCFLIVWASLLLCCYGWKIILKFINKKMPFGMSLIFCAIIMIVSVVWIFRLTPALSNAAIVSPACSNLLIASMTAIIVFATAGLLFYKGKGALRIITMTVIMSLMIFSNHFTLSRSIGSGKMDIEFRMLAEWFVANTAPGEKLVTSLPDVVALFAPSRKGDIVHVSSIGGKNADEFVQSCYKRGIKYVAWDSRVGIRPTYTYYGQWGIKRIDHLKEARDQTPYRIVAQKGLTGRTYINIFRLEPPRK